MVNPFDEIEARLSNLENLLLDLKHETLPQLLKELINPGKRIVNIDGLMKAHPSIATSKQTIYNWTSSGKIPHSKRNGRPYFDLDEIDQWLMSEKKLTASEIQEEIENHIRTSRK